MEINKRVLLTFIILCTCSAQPKLYAACNSASNGDAVILGFLAREADESSGESSSHADE